MKHKASLILMEQLIMLLVFALAAAICLGLFAGAHRVSLQAQEQDIAVILCRNGAETLKACSGNLSAAAELLGGQPEEARITARYDADLTPDPEGDYLLTVQFLPSNIAGLSQAEVLAARSDAPHTPLFSITVSWQEVAK